MMTIRQRKFAQLVAAGTTLIEAHDRVYGVGKGTRKTRREMASALAGRPHVRAEIEAYEDQLSPLPELRQLKQEALQNVRWLAKSSSSQTVRLAASKLLLDECNSREDREQKLLDRGPVGVEILLSELASLRDKQEPATLELEAVSEADPAGMPSAARDDPADADEPLQPEMEYCSD
jgi:hypothetical protein